MGRSLNILMSVLYLAISEERVPVVPTPDEVEAVALVKVFCAKLATQGVPMS